MKIFNCLLLVAVMLIVAPQLPGHTAPPDGKFKDFTLTLSTPKKQYLELEPLPILLTLKNETDSPLVGHTVLEFGAGFVQIYVTGEDGSPRRIEDLSALKILIGPERREFNPGEEHKQMERLNFKLNEVFPKPGVYQLTARLMSSDGKESVSSKPWKVRIVKPDGIDAEALEFIRTHGEPAYFFSGLKLTNPEKEQVLENFVALYNQSTYFDEASLLLARVQFSKGEYQKARAQLERLSKKPDFPFAAQASEYLKRIEREENKKNRPQ